MAEWTDEASFSNAGAASGCPSAEAIDQFVTEGLGNENVRCHLESCARCLRIVEEIRKDNDLIRPFAAAVRDDPTESQDGIAVPRIEGYQILSEIHRGGQGIVYKAIQKATQRKVAVKMLLPGVLSSAKHRIRFEREIIVIAQLRHPNIITLFDSGVTTEGRHYYAMEYLRGVPLDEFVHRKWSASAGSAMHGIVEGILRLFAKVCEAVQYAYQRGVIHRDLKPNNILVDSEGEPHVLDFGLAKTARAELTAERNLATQTGEFLGTLAYAAPEQVRGLPQQADTRTDVYALGVMLYELLTGTLPYPIDGPLTAVIRNITEVDPIRPSAYRLGMDDDVDRIVLKALAKDRDRRYQSAESMRRDIFRFLANEPIDAKRDSTWYVVRKIVRRHKVACVVIAAFGVLGTAFVGLLTAFAVNRDVFATRIAGKNDELLLANRKLQLETGRAALQAGDTVRAESLLWEVFLNDPMSANSQGGGLVADSIRPLDSYWALWNFYAQQPCVRTWKGQEGMLWSVDMSPDGRLLASSGPNDNTIKVWEVSSGSQVRAIPASTDSPGAVAFSPDGAFLGWGTAEGTLQLWDIAQNRVHDSMLQGQTGHIWPIAFHPRGNTLACGAGRGVRLLNMNTGEEQALGEHDDVLNDLSFDTEGMRLASIDYRSVGKLWDVRTRRLLKTFASFETRTDQQLGASAICFHPDGQKLAAAINSGPFEVGTYDIQTGAFRRLFTPSDAATDLRITRDGRWLVTSTRDGRLSLWDFERNESRGVLAVHGAEVRAIALSADGRVVVSAGHDGVIRLWELKRNQCFRALAGHGFTVHGVQFSPNGRLLASAGADGSIRIWNAESGELQQSLMDHPDANDADVVAGVAFDRDGRRLVSGSHEGTIRIWDLPTGQCLRVLKKAHDKAISFVTWSPDGSFVASGSDDRTVKLWDTTTGDCSYTFVDHVHRIPCVCFSPDGRWLASCSKGDRKGKICLHDPVTKKSHSMADDIDVRALCFSPDGQVLASGHDGGQIRLWDVATGEQADAWQAHSDDIFSLSFHPGGHLLASASRGRDIKLWDARPNTKERNLITLKGHQSMVFSVCFSPDGRTLASGSEDKLVGLWDLTYYQRHIDGNRDHQLKRLVASHGSNE